MKIFAYVALALGLSVGAANASQIDFSTSAFSSTYQFPGPYLDTKTIDGVNFDFSVTSKGADGYRQSYDDAGQQFGVPGNGVYQIDIVANVDLAYNWVSGEERSTPGHGPLLFDFLINGSDFVSDGFFTPNGFTNLALGASVAAGQTFSIFADISSSSGDAAHLTAVIGALDFTRAQVPSVPLPAGMPLLLAGLGGLVVLRRRRV